LLDTRQIFCEREVVERGKELRECRDVHGLIIMAGLRGCGLDDTFGDHMENGYISRRLFAGLMAGALLGGSGVVAQQGAVAPAPAATAVVPSPKLAGIAHVALRVANLDASVAFYEKLGFVKAFALSRDGAVYEAFIKIDDRQFLELYPVDAKNTQIGFLHLCFEGKDLPAVHDYYVAHGLTPNAVRTAGAGNLLFTMPGPASPTGPQNMEYTQYMPGSLHSKDFGQHLGAGRIATGLVTVKLAVDDPAGAKAFYLTKLGFDAVAGTENVVALPGNPEETIEFAPKSPQGFKSSIVLEVASVAKAGVALAAAGVTFEKKAKGLSLMDPDGNDIVLMPKVAPAVAMVR
jgi:catechol 2,3-dioxygenase-like lactoylglutathione lyase family enzyme